MAELFVKKICLRLFDLLDSLIVFGSRLDKDRLLALPDPAYVYFAHERKPDALVVVEEKLGSHSEDLETANPLQVVADFKALFAHKHVIGLVL